MTTTIYNNTRITVYSKQDVSEYMGDGFPKNTIAEPGIYVPRPGSWVGPFIDMAEADAWDAAHPLTTSEEMMHDTAENLNWEIVAP